MRLERIRDLLAILHRDGGHYTEQVGVTVSLERAIELAPWYIDRTDYEEETLP
jgi:hypothetical protein